MGNFKKDTDEKVVIRIDSKAKDAPKSFKVTSSISKQYKKLMKAAKQTSNGFNLLGEKYSEAFQNDEQNSFNKLSEILKKELPQSNNKKILSAFEELQEKMFDISNSSPFVNLSKSLKELQENCKPILDTSLIEALKGNKIFTEGINGELFNNLHPAPFLTSNIASKVVKPNLELYRDIMFPAPSPRTEPVKYPEIKITIRNFPSAKINSSLSNFISKLNVSEDIKDCMERRIEDFNNNDEFFTANEFSVLNTLYENPSSSNEELADILNYSVRYIQDLLKDIREKLGFNLIDDDKTKRTLLTLFVL